MNPNYALFIDIQLSKPITSEGIWLRLVTRIPFVPRDGDKLVLTSTDQESTLTLELDNTTYDMSEGYFISEILDESIVEQYQQDGTHHEADAIAQYTPFGFVRLNYPQREGRE